MRLPTFLVALTVPALLGGQVIDLTINDVGLAIGDKPYVTGLRINYRDRNLRQVNGVNITVWSPYNTSTGTVNGIALGLPVTGARAVNGVTAGILGAGAERSLSGIAVGGLGVGAGGNARGILLGLIGVGAGGSVTGFSFGGIGVGSGGGLHGVQIGGIGVGGGGDLTGISIGGIGVGSGGNVTGLAIGGVGVGSGGTIHGLAFGVIGVGAPRIEGIAIGGAVGGENVKAIVLAPGYFKITDRGRFDGGALSLVTNVHGEQHGLTIGLFNYAHELHGAQIGLINISDNGGDRRVLPILSVR